MLLLLSLSLSWCGVRAEPRFRPGSEPRAKALTRCRAPRGSGALHRTLRPTLRVLVALAGTCVLLCWHTVCMRCYAQSLTLRRYAPGRYAPGRYAPSRLLFVPLVVGAPLLAVGTPSHAPQGIHPAEHPPSVPALGYRPKAWVGTDPGRGPRQVRRPGSGPLANAPSLRSGSLRSPLLRTLAATVRAPRDGAVHAGLAVGWPAAC